MTAQATPDGTFQHEALFYKGNDEYLAGMVPYMSEALASDGPIMVAVSDEKRRLLSGELGGDAEAVHFVDMAELGRNPARIIPAWRAFADEHESEQLWGIGEPAWPGRSDEELAECRSHESLLNLALDGTALRLLCPYDAAGLPDEALEDARCTHPVVTDHGWESRSDDYLDPRAAPGPFEGSLRPRAADADELSFGIGQLGQVRVMVANQAQQAGMSRQQTQDFVLAADELASNTVTHGGGHGTLRVWSETGTVLVEAEDAGHIEEPLVGRIQPDAYQDGGRGLWLANQICDLLQLRSSSSGTVARIQLRADGARRAAPNQDPGRTRAEP